MKDIELLDLLEFLELSSSPDPPEEAPDNEYEVIPDRIIRLAKANYERYAAYYRFAELAQKNNLMCFEFTESETHYTWKCIKI